MAETLSAAGAEHMIGLYRYMTTQLVLMEQNESYTFSPSDKANVILIHDDLRDLVKTWYRKVGDVENLGFDEEIDSPNRELVKAAPPTMSTSPSHTTALENEVRELEQSDAMALADSCKELATYILWLQKTRNGQLRQYDYTSLKNTLATLTSSIRYLSMSP